MLQLIKLYVQQVLRKHFTTDREISYAGLTTWQPCSRDIKSHDFCLWGYLKNLSFENVWYHWHIWMAYMIPADGKHLNQLITISNWKSCPQTADFTFWRKELYEAVYPASIRSLWCDSFVLSNKMWYKCVFCAF